MAYRCAKSLFFREDIIKFRAEAIRDEMVEKMIEDVDRCSYSLRVKCIPKDIHKFYTA